MKNPLTRTLAAAALALAAGFANAALDSSATTDDHSINAPTPWWTYGNISAAELASRLADTRARLVDLEVITVNSAGEPRFVARAVPNSGAYAVSGWWWYYDQTAAQVATLLTTHSARLIELERYVRPDGQERYAVVMVANTGSAARGWSYLLGVTAQQLASHLSANNMRPIDLDSMGSGSAQRFNAVMVRNSGTDFKPFAWSFGQTPASIASLVTSFQGRVVKIDRQADGRYSFVQVKASGDDATAWWHRYGFTSLTDLNQYAQQFGARPVDIVSYSVAGTRTYDAAFIDNANTGTRRMRAEFATLVDAPTQTPKGIFGTYLKPVGAAPLIDLNSGRRQETASALKALHLLWQMKQVQRGNDTLGESFDYYYIPGSGDPEDRCPDPNFEIPNNLLTTTVKTAMDQMMKISDNRTTRGVVLRAGGFDPLNSLAAQAGMAGTTVRHNIGCGYMVPSNGAYSPSTLRNDTTAADLARLYEGVWTQQLLTNTRGARDAWLAAANPTPGGWPEVSVIVREEAEAQGKTAVVSSFLSAMRLWYKGGNYGTCLGVPSQPTECGQAVVVYAWGGLVGIPFRDAGSGFAVPRYYSFGNIVSDVPVTDWNDPRDVNAQETFNRTSVELFRDEIRAALQTW